jgi:glycerol-3-phosphate acyltransferase PlsY
MFQSTAILLFGYLLGSIPTAVWYAKAFHGLDIRQHGSGNAGATNSLRVLGKKAGIIVLILDTIKGLIPVLAARYFHFDEPIVFLTGLAAVIGHILPIFAYFRGGKGVATSLGVILSVSPFGALVSLVFFILIVFSTGYVSLGSLVAAFIFIIYFLITNSGDLYMISIASGLFFLLLITHRENVKRLVKGTENKFSRKK